MTKGYLFHPGIFLILFLSLTGRIAGQPATFQALWRTGEGNYKGYRIPSLLVTGKGTLLAFAEGRNDGGDSGDIDVVLKRSTDNGKSWSIEILVWNDSLNTCGNPCPVVDRSTGRIWLFMTWNAGKDHEREIIRKTSAYPRIPCLCYSDDDGLHWSVPVKLPESRDPSWGWYATGPGIGICLENGKHKGRLVIPANHSYDDPINRIGTEPFGYGSHVLFSDDHGKSWNMSEPIRPGCNESQVAELTDGTLVMNMRSYNKKNCRAISRSLDGGETWSSITHDLQLVESMCQASLIRWGNFRGKEYHLFSNPAVPSGRTHMTIRISDDNCQTWYASKLLYAGPSGYSCLAPLAGNRVGILFEQGEKNPYETITFARFRMKKLMDKSNLQLHSRPAR